MAKDNETTATPNPTLQQVEQVLTRAVEQELTRAALAGSSAFGKASAFAKSGKSFLDPQVISAVSNLDEQRFKTYAERLTRLKEITTG